MIEQIKYFMIGLNLGLSICIVVLIIISKKQNTEIEFMPDDEIKKQADKHGWDGKSMWVMQDIIRRANNNLNLITMKKIIGYLCAIILVTFFIVLFISGWMHDDVITKVCTVIGIFILIVYGAIWGLGCRNNTK